jgi:hypothetical protein
MCEIYIGDMSAVISSFDPIHITERTLVLCDIDNTLLYPTETNTSPSELRALYAHYRRVFPLAPKTAAQLATDTYYARYPMRPTDAYGFARMLQKIRSTPGCELVFLTARSPDTLDFTAANFIQIGLAPEDHIIHFSDTMPKGKYVSLRIPVAPYDTVVFIDDLQENLDNMARYVDPAKLRAYLFVMQT